MKKETIEQIYHKIKSESELPVGMLMYITYTKNNGFDGGNNICIDFKSDKESIDKLKEISNKEYFYAFWNSKKDKKFYNDNKKVIINTYTNMVLQNAGYGNKICKN